MRAAAQRLQVPVVRAVDARVHQQVLRGAVAALVVEVAERKAAVGVLLVCGGAHRGGRAVRSEEQRATRGLSIICQAYAVNVHLPKTK